MSASRGFVDYPAASRVSELDVEALPTRAISRLLLAVSEDALGRSVRVPVLVARGAHPGPTLGLTAALHGNELNGIPVLHRLFADIDLQRLRGAVVGVVVVNVPGLLRNERVFQDGRDLNHLMPGKPAGTDSEVYAHRFVSRVVRHLDYLIDLHTASFGRVNSLYIRADLNNELTARMARRLRPQILLHNPPSDKTLRGTAMEMGIPAITLEIGDPQAYSLRFIKASVSGIRAVIGDLGLYRKTRLAEGPAPVVCRSSSWLYTRGGGFLEVGPALTARVEQGDRVARLTNAFGDVVEETLAPSGGIVIGKSVNPVGPSGARILHLGCLAVPEDNFWSQS